MLPEGQRSKGVGDPKEPLDLTLLRASPLLPVSYFEICLITELGKKKKKDSDDKSVENLCPSTGLSTIFGLGSCLKAGPQKVTC